jgi:hypothetical protein
MDEHWDCQLCNCIVSLLLFVLYSYHCMWKWLINTYQFFLCLCSWNIVQKSVHCSHSTKLRWSNIHLNSTFFCMIHRWKNKSYKSCKRRFCHKYLGVWIPASSAVFELNKVCSTGTLIDKKYTRQTAVLTEEKLDRTGAGLHLPCKFLTWLAQQKQVSTITA